AAGKADRDLHAIGPRKGLWLTDGDRHLDVPGRVHGDHLRRLPAQGALHPLARSGRPSVQLRLSRGAESQTIRHESGGSRPDRPDLLQAVSPRHAEAIVIAAKRRLKLDAIRGPGEPRKVVERTATQDAELLIV